MLKIEISIPAESIRNRRMVKKKFLRKFYPYKSKKLNHLGIFFKIRNKFINVSAKSLTHTRSTAYIYR